MRTCDNRGSSNLPNVKQLLTGGAMIKPAVCPESKLWSTPMPCSLRIGHTLGFWKCFFSNLTLKLQEYKRREQTSYVWDLGCWDLKVLTKPEVMWELQEHDWLGGHKWHFWIRKCWTYTKRRRMAMFQTVFLVSWINKYLQIGNIGFSNTKCQSNCLTFGVLFGVDD